MITLEESLGQLDAEFIKLQSNRPRASRVEYRLADGTRAIWWRGNSLTLDYTDRGRRLVVTRHPHGYSLAEGRDFYEAMSRKTLLEAYENHEPDDWWE